MIVTSLPIWITDVVGSILMIVFSFLCLNLARTLKVRDPGNVIWTYLFWVCLGLACFAVSRSAGHILKQILVLFGYESAWSAIRPFSGAVNSLMFVFVASVTLFLNESGKFIARYPKTSKSCKPCGTSCCSSIRIWKVWLPSVPGNWLLPSTNIDAYSKFRGI